jgi:serine/threonine protein kinase
MIRRTRDSRTTEVVPSSTRTTIASTATVVPASTEPVHASKVPGSFTISSHCYRVVSTLSQATGEATLYLAEYRGKRVVAKHYHQSRKQEKIKLLERIQGIRKKPLVQILGVGVQDERPFEVMEYALGGTLRDLKPYRDPVNLRRIILSVADSINALHQAGIVHCDVKPENILFLDAEQQTPVLSDFGIAEFLDRNGKATTEKKGSPLYAAPEAHAVAGNMIRVYPASDWYSLGISILDVWAADSPFPFASDLDLMESKLQGLIKPPPDMPEELQRLVSGLVMPLVESRWGFKEIKRWSRGGVTVPEIALDVPISTGNIRRPAWLQATADGDNGLNASLLLSAALGVVSVIRPRIPFPSNLSDINPLLVPLFILACTVGVWIIQKGEPGRLLSTLVAGPIGGVVVAIASFWILSFACSVPFLLSAGCAVGTGVLLLLRPPKAVDRMLVAAALAGLLVTYLLHTPPFYTLTKLFVR